MLRKACAFFENKNLKKQKIQPKNYNCDRDQKNEKYIYKFDKRKTTP